jgi:SAM-dependent methyltransferase
MRLEKILLEGRRSPLSHIRAAARGFRYARRLPAPRYPRVNTEQRNKGVLETYFDDHREGAGIWKWRHYFELYERHLGKFVGEEVHVVEVGVFSGGSLPMWRAYFGDRCQVYGVDIEPACKAYEADRVRVFIGDQSDPEFWARFREAVPFVDILIDDGGHEAPQQIETLEAMLPHLRPGGVYVCEDIHGPFHPFHAYLDALCRRLNDLECASIHNQVHGIHRYPLLTVIEKPPVPQFPFEAPRRGTQWQPFL